ncbi:MAG: argininosuccinate synthase [Candidatus Dadabacteria bacterium]|nr:MAG: argininosuccinate synthase [Candidatus Dadabacteria bacterium]
MPTEAKTVVVAFSGGLDTTFCVAYLKEQGYRVETVTVDNGGFDGSELALIKERAFLAGANRHHQIKVEQETYDKIIQYIIKGNILKGNCYPLCVGAERFIQAEKLVELARKLNAQSVCHGCTAAGNDHIRFETALRALAPELDIIAPIRDLEITREDEFSFLAKRNIKINNRTETYSINRGILGTTIGGKESHHSWLDFPEDAYTLTKNPDLAPAEGLSLEIEFSAGLPVALDGCRLTGLEILKRLNALAALHGFGRGIHCGDTIMGIKGRIAFEAPGILTLIEAHRELEKLVLTASQVEMKEMLAVRYGQMLHSGLYKDAAMRDIESFLNSSQRFVSGKVKVLIKRGVLRISGVDSPYSLINPKAHYGETSSLWSSADAAGFARIFGQQAVLSAWREFNYGSGH